MKALGALSSLLVAGPPLLALGAQIPFYAIADQAPDTARVLEERWNFDLAPSPNATDNYIFETVSSLLQQWPNTRYRNGVFLTSSTQKVTLTSLKAITSSPSQYPLTPFYTTAPGTRRSPPAPNGWPPTPNTHTSSAGPTRPGRDAGTSLSPSPAH